MYRLREIERYDLPEINKWHNDKELSKKLGGVQVCKFIYR